MKRFGLIIVGDEILSGKRQDKHLPKVIAALGERGLSLSWAQYLGDDRSALIETLKRTFGGDDVVFCTGGIGATPDDHTRQAAAAALGLDLQLHPEAERLIAQRMAEMNQGPLDTAEARQRMRMGEFPAGADIIPNPFNRIPGFLLREHYFVPGFPVMAWPMLEWVLDTRYADLFHRAPQAERSMLVYAIAESTLTPLMEQLEAVYALIKVFSLPSVGEPDASGKPTRRHIEIGVKGPAEAIPAAWEALRQGITAMSADFQEM